MDMVRDKPPCYQLILPPRACRSGRGGTVLAEALWSDNSLLLLKVTGFTLGFATTA